MCKSVCLYVTDFPNIAVCMRVCMIRWDCVISKYCENYCIWRELVGGNLINTSYLSC